MCTHVTLITEAVILKVPSIISNSYGNFNKDFVSTAFLAAAAYLLLINLSCSFSSTTYSITGQARDINFSSYKASFLADARLLIG